METSPLLLRTAGELTAGALLQLAVAGMVAWALGLGLGYLGWVLILYAVMVGLLLPHLPPGPGIQGLGWPNRVTLLRATLALAVAALLPAAWFQGLGPAGVELFREAPESGAWTGPPEYWWVIGLAALALVLDGVDGWTARRTGESSAMGARFDMELDAFLMLMLSLLVWESGRVGAWVLLIGALRYLFVAAGWIWSSLQGELPPSVRRKTVCVVQGVALLICLGPIVPPGWAVAVAAAALGFLILSFGVDVRWLLTPSGPEGRGLGPAQPESRSEEMPAR